MEPHEQWIRHQSTRPEWWSEVGWSVGFEVPRVLAEDEYLDVSHEVSGVCTTAEIQSTQ